MLIEDLIARKMDVVDATQDSLARYAGVSGALVSGGLRGTKPFSAEVARRLDDTLNDLIRLKNLCAPIPVDMRKIRDVQFLLDLMRNNQSFIPAVATVPPSDVENARRAGSEEVLTLVHEILNSDADHVCSNHGWTKAELSQRIIAASAQLHHACSEMAAARIDREQLGK